MAREFKQGDTGLTRKGDKYLITFDERTRFTNTVKYPLHVDITHGDNEFPNEYFMMADGSLTATIETPHDLMEQ